MDKNYQLLPQRIIMEPNVIYEVPVINGQISCSINRLSGGSLIIGGTYALDSFGVTVAFGATTGRIMGDCEVLSFNSTGSFYMVCTGATTIVQVLRGLSYDISV